MLFLFGRKENLNCLCGACSRLVSAVNWPGNSYIVTLYTLSLEVETEHLVLIWARKHHECFQVEWTLVFIGNGLFVARPFCCIEVVPFRFIPFKTDLWLLILAFNVWKRLWWNSHFFFFWGEGGEGGGRGDSNGVTAQNPTTRTPVPRGIWISGCEVFQFFSLLIFKAREIDILNGFLLVDVSLKELFQEFYQNSHCSNCYQTE